MRTNIIARKIQPLNEPAVDVYVGANFETAQEAYDDFCGNYQVRNMRYSHLMLLESNGVRRSMHSSIRSGEILVKSGTN